jgi:hypothetical protein
MYRSLFVVAIIVGLGGLVLTANMLFLSTDIVSWMAEPPYDDCPYGKYQGTSGDCVPKPNSSDDNVTAICRDGSHSHAEHTTGACSRHGGVLQWCPCNFTSGNSLPRSWRTHPALSKSKVWRDPS